jgi:peptidyl-prolyl cis-trans isomerase D
MLKTMRSTVGKIVTIGLFALLILSFAVWGIGDIFRGQGADSVVAKVGDREITVAEYSRVLQQEVNRTQQMLGRSLDGDQIRDFGVAERALERLITQTSIDLLSDDLGMTVTEEQLRESIRQDPGFQGPDGQFDPSLLRNALFANNMSESMFLGVLSKSIARQQLLDAAFAGLEVPDAFAMPLYAYENETRDARYVTLFHSAFADIEDPEEVALQSFYQEQKQNFMAPEYRALTVVRITAEDLMDEVAVSEEQLREEYELRKSSFEVPETRTLTQVVLSSEEDAQALAAAAQEGKTLAAAAEELGLPGPVDLGSVTKDELPGAVAETAFQGEAGSVVGPAASPLGFHVIRIDGVTAGSLRTFEEVRDELTRELKRGQAIDSLVTLANEFDDTIAGGASLEEAAAALALPIQSIDAVDRSGRTPDGALVEGLEPREAILTEAYQLEPGLESLLIETGDDGYFMVRVDGITPESERPLSEVRDSVIRRWKQEERARLAGELAEAIQAKAAEGLTLEAAIEAVEKPEGMNLVVETTEGVARNERDQQKVPSPQFTSTLFQMEPEEVRTTVGPLAEIVVRLSAIETPEPSEDQQALDDLRAVTLGAMQNDLGAQLLQALREEQGVSVNRQQIDLLLQNYL